MFLLDCPSRSHFLSWTVDGCLDIYFFVMIIYSLEYSTFLSPPHFTIPHDSLIFSRWLDFYYFLLIICIIPLYLCTIWFFFTSVNFSDSDSRTDLSCNHNNERTSTALLIVIVIPFF